jgi:hypothetical protein
MCAMNKLNLNDLNVETFATEASEANPRGTVKAHSADSPCEQTDPVLCETTNTCNNTCGATCYNSCNGTCDASCNGTCDASCNGTCWYTVCVTCDGGGYCPV